LDDVAAFYHPPLCVQHQLIALNTKTYSAELPLYESILAATCESGARFFTRHSRGGPPPVILTLKDPVATGDEVTQLAAASPAEFG